MSLKTEHISFLNKLEAHLIEAKRGRKRQDKKIAKKERRISPEDLVKPEDLPENENENEDVTESQEGLSELKEDSKEQILSKLEKISDPKLLIIHSKVSDTLAEDEDEQVADSQRRAYRDFLDDRKELLASCINLTNEDDINVWIVSADNVKDLSNILRYYLIAYQFTDLPDNLLEHDAPFDDIRVTLKGVNKEMLRTDLSGIWNDVLENRRDEEEDVDGTDDQEDQEDQERKEDQVVQDEDDDSKILEDLPDDENDEDESEYRVDLAKIKKLQKPYLFILSPIEPDSYLEFTANSKVLPKLQKSGMMFLESGDKKRIGDRQKGASVYFVSENDYQPLVTELKASRPVYRLGLLLGKDETIADFFNKEEPFTDLTLKGQKVDRGLVNELNAKWKRHASESSGNVIPAVQINNRVPISFLRMLSKEHKELYMYLGDRPSGAGMSGAAYIPTKSEAEAAAFVSLMRKFKFPSLFYKYLYVDSDIDAKFKRTAPQMFTPKNVLILMGKFKPEEEVTLTEDQQSLLKEKKATQLELLHAFAQKVLKNQVRNPGSFVKGSYTIGTVIANFNADMSICFLWGSATDKVTVTKSDVLKQLPFVDKLITSYL
jgi:hypothetical protein